jgi:LEA14-like dessication related protein
MKTIQVPFNIIRFPAVLCWFAALIFLLSGCNRPKEPIVLKQIRDVVVDANTEPFLKAQAVFHNPNNTRGKIRKIKVDIFVNGKKAGEIDQDFHMTIPAKSDFTIPLEVKLSIKEFGFLDTLFGMIGGKRVEVQYKGVLKLSYHGVPIRVPVDYKDEIRLNF